FSTSPPSGSGRRSRARKPPDTEGLGRDCRTRPTGARFLSQTVVAQDAADGRNRPRPARPLALRAFGTSIDPPERRIGHAGLIVPQPFMPSQKLRTLQKNVEPSGLLSSLSRSNSLRSSRCLDGRFTGVSTATSISMSPIPPPLSAGIPLPLR